MPSIRLLGRCWGISSDDFPIPAACLVLFHSAWIGVIAWLDSASHGNKQKCDVHSHCHTYLVMLLCLFAFSTLVEVGIVVEGCKGSLFESSARRHMPTLLYAHFITVVATLATNIWGSMLLYDGSCACEEWGPTVVLVWSTWAVVIGVSAAVVLTFKVFPEASTRNPKRWMIRLRCIARTLCCHIRSKLMEATTEGGESPLDRVADIVWKLFGHIDMTMSDVAATVYLARLLQKMSRQAAIAKAKGMASGELLLGSDSMGRASDYALKSSAGTSCQQHELDEDYSEPSMSYSRFSSSHQGTVSHPVVEASRACLHYSFARRPVHITTVQEASHFSKFASASYGALLYIWVKPKVSGLCMLCCGRDWCACCCQPSPQEELRRWEEELSGRHDQKLIPGHSLQYRLERSRRALTDAMNVSDRINREAFLQISGINDEDLIYDSSKNAFLDTVPYFIAIDRSTRSIVLAVRGTLSMTDAVTDIMCHPLDVQKWLNGNPRPTKRPANGGAPSAPGGPRAAPQQQENPECSKSGSWRDPDASGWGHNGIMTVARGVILDLEERGLLTRLLYSVSRGGELGSMGLDHQMSQGSDDNDIPMLAGLLSHRNLPSSPSIGQHQGLKNVQGTGWRLVITGHSLGGGVSAFLGLYFRPLVPNLRVWCFSPPGALMSPSLATATQSFITSVVVHKDIIPRLTVKSLEKLRDEMVLAGVRCKLNKTQLLLSTFWNGIFGRRKLELDRAAKMFVSATELNADGEEMLHRFQMSLSRTVTDGELEIARTFCLPGEIILLRPFKPKSSQKLSAREYREHMPVWISYKDIEAEGIILSPNMLISHLPDVSDIILERTAERMARQAERSQGLEH